ncbi:HPr kinase/phosphatase C-terminal domain-containing protein [Xanthomonas campestris pv. raphani]|uniref:HPr kinase/phosphatase C-terminal domain-containing protein n=1 Tax=Xanthomonas campestris TaxID=339 RepID=UPI000CDB582C|nr:HPr kinase/phosphatase C-terminal domain-containing protein [Xanthomonas campestris]MEA9788380.1 HPr kinase/phosphatase C-terminal domain-containing protein [Xanthomonas campestris pv. raphani]TXD42185.1 serine kinase [Xanthomonas campestris]
MPQSAAVAELAPISALRAERAHAAMPAPLDPFDEQRPRRHGVRKQVLGASFHFESDSPALLALVEAAYAGLPAHRFDGAPQFHITLDVVARAPRLPVAEPPPVRTHAAAGLLCGVMDECNYLMVSVAERRAMVVVSDDMLIHAYHLRYELIEFAVFLLAARGMSLVPLHGACVGWQGRGALLLGASGAGKSTLALHSLLRGLQFVAEDGVFVEPHSLVATGVANFLHLRSASLGLLDAPTRAWISAAPTIRRRSGVEKFEVDLRDSRAVLAPAPLPLAAVVLLSDVPATDPAHLLTPMAHAEIAACLAADQPYAAGQPGWLHFIAQVQQRGVYRMQRGAHPDAAVDALLQLLHRAASSLPGA